MISVKLNLANSFIQIESEFTVLKVFNFHWSVLIDSQNLSRFLTVQLSMFFVLLSCDSLIILSNRCSFVKHFFYFLNSVLSSLSCDSLFILSCCFWFVKNFFKFFQIFFQPIYCLLTACLLYHSFKCLSTSFFIYFLFSKK